MGRDLDLQYEGLVPAGGIHIDSGKFDISSGSQTVDVPTVLSQCKMGLGVSQTSDPQYQTALFTTDGDVTDGKITFQRVGGFMSEDVRFNYILFGH